MTCKVEASSSKQNCTKALSHESTLPEHTRSRQAWNVFATNEHVNCVESSEAQ